MTRSESSRGAMALLLVACLVPLVWPGDISFINDEPLLVRAAMSANREHTLANIGLLGTYGFSYGPVPTWVYQVLLAITHDLVVVATLHTLVMVATTAAALWWLSRSLGLWAWFAPVPLLSPYFWFYSRVLWDNPFLIPLGALAIAGYSAHLVSGSARGLRVSLGAMVAALLVHLMSLALVIPLAAHMLLVRRRDLWAHRLSLAVIGSASMAAWGYWKYLLASRMPPPGPAAGTDGWLFPLTGARLFSARHLDYFFGPGPVESPEIRLAAAVSWLAYLLVWGGIGVAIWRMVDAVRVRRWSPKAHLASIVVGMLVCQSLIDGFSAKFQHPQYQNATWIASAVLGWFAVDYVAGLRGVLRWTAAATTGLLGGALLLSVVVIAIGLHRTGGSRETYGPTLANQQDVARALARYSPRVPLSSRVILYDLYPHTLAVLRELNPARSEVPDRDLELRYRSSDPTLGKIELVER